MATLHWVAFGPERLDLIKQVEVFFAPTDALLFIDAGILHGLDPASPLINLSKKNYYHPTQNSQVNNYLAQHWQAINQADIAKLSFQYERLITWHP